MPGSPRTLAYLALASVCFFWGTVYLAFRIAVESFPPAILMGGRFLSAGVLILLVAWAVGARLPSRRDFLITSFNGLLTLGLGIGAVAFSVQWIPSGWVALLGTTTPFWMVGIEALRPGGNRPNAATLAGMVVGLLGALLLILPGALAEGFGGGAVLSFVLLQIGAAGFAVGAIRERNHDSNTHPIVNAAVQEVATGLVFLVPGLLLPHDTIHWTSKGLLAVLYLIVFGGIVGFSAFIYAMKVLPVALVSIYTYVNPIVAVIVAAWLYGEKLGWIEGLSMMFVVAGVIIVQRFAYRERIATATA